jgi:bacterioferritin-associated ferredoxin
MLICHCYAVTEGTIRRCVAQEGACAETVAQRLGAGAGCGGCRSAVEEIVESETRAQEVSRSLPQVA